MIVMMQCGVISASDEGLGGSEKEHSVILIFDNGSSFSMIILEDILVPYIDFKSTLMTLTMTKCQINPDVTAPNKSVP